jgi:hypothetical protein
MRPAAGGTPWFQTPWSWLVLAATAAAASGFGCIQAPQACLQSYWIALVTWTGLSVAALVILAVHGLVGGAWGELLAPPLAAATRPLWMLSLLFLPPLLLLPEIFAWARPPLTATEPLGGKSQYLNVAWFQLRAACYLFCWLVLAAALTRRRVRAERPIEFPTRAPLAVAEQPLTKRPGPLTCGLALLLLILSITFASIDWMMSLTPQWHSSAYGVLVLAGTCTGILGFAILGAAWLAPKTSMVAAAGWWRDTGNLLLAAICFWAYIAFAQFHIIWSGNLPEEVPWYLERARHPWRNVAIGLAIGHFALPFAALLSNWVKQRRWTLAGVAGLIWIMHLVDVWWMMAPAFHDGQTDRILMDAVAQVTIGSLWMLMFFLRRPLWIGMEMDEASPSRYSA